MLFLVSKVRDEIQTVHSLQSCLKQAISLSSHSICVGKNIVIGRSVGLRPAFQCELAKYGGYVRKWPLCIRMSSVMTVCVMTIDTITYRLCPIVIHNI